MTKQALPRVAIDIGNSRLKFGLFETVGAAALPTPERWLDVVPGRDSLSNVAQWLAPLEIQEVQWWIASVNRLHATELLDWLRSYGSGLSVTLLASSDLPLTISLDQPDRVGIDRLVGAVAVNQLRDPKRAAIAVDLGTAITVDLISADGAFQGGAILPGISMSARAMHEFTDLLPLIDMASLAEAPPAVGTSTIDAMQSGLFWGAIGGIRELIARMTASPHPPQIFLTGGAAPSVAGLLNAEAHYVPHLMLSGIALAALSMSALRT